MTKLSLVPRGPAGPLDRIINDYLLDKRATGASPKTIKIYADALHEVLLPYCAAVGVTELGQLTNHHLHDLSVGLLDGTRSRSGRPLAKPTVRSYSRAINAFLRWATESGETVGAKAKLPSVGKRVLDVLSRDEIRAMEDAATTERDKLIVRILADTGMRLGELLKLTPGDIRTDGRKHYLKVRGKGDKERLVPVQPALSVRVNRYAQRTRKDSPSTRLFLTNRRRPGTGEYEPLTDSGTQQMIRVLAEAAGIKKRVYPHLFRHSFITEQLRRGLNPILLARIVGHESLAMINTVYQHLTMDDAHDALMTALLGENGR